MPTPTQPNETHVDAVARSLHRHHEARYKARYKELWPNTCTKYADLDSVSRNEYRVRAGEIITALHGTETVEEAAHALAKVWCAHGPALVKYMTYAHERITETLSDVPDLKETK